MSEAVVRKIRPAALETEETFGPAEVIEVGPRGMVVTFPDGKSAEAEAAFSMPYAPAVGDTLLVIGKGSKLYAIGVIHGFGRTALSFSGDVDIRSRNGKLTLTGDRGVEVSGPEVDIYSTAIRMVARDLTQKFDMVCQRVSSLLRVHAGESQTIVDGAVVTQAKRASILTEETVAINGREIHLG